MDTCILLCFSSNIMRKVASARPTLQTNELFKNAVAALYKAATAAAVRPRFFFLFFFVNLALLLLLIFFMRVREYRCRAINREKEESTFGGEESFFFFFYFTYKEVSTLFTAEARTIVNV